MVPPDEDAGGRPDPPMKPTMSLREIGIFMNSKQRRATLQPMRGAGTAWIDQDDSGTYDPKAKHRRAVTTARRIKKQPVDTDEGGNSRTSRQPRNTRPVGYALPITFKFTTQMGLDYLRSITPGPFSGSESIDDDSSDARSVEIDTKESSLRRRRRTGPEKKSKSAPVRENGLTLDVLELTVGHPQRRGCKACFENNDDECSLIEHSYDYPCAACVDAGTDCELIIPPELKKVCERCKKTRINCSFRRNGGKGVDVCEACEKADATCCAGPLKDSSYSRRYNNTLDEDGNARLKVTQIAPPPNPTVPRQYISCNQCRGEGLKCNLKRDQPGPCSKCKAKGQNCEFVLIRQPREATTPPALKRRGDTKSTPTHRFPSPSGFQTTLGEEIWFRGAGKRISRNDKGSVVERNSGNGKKQGRNLTQPMGGRRSRIAITHSGSPPSSPELIGHNNGYTHIKITTAFSHPIKFNHVPPPNGTVVCNWCAPNQTFFGLYGFGEKVVEVIPYPEGYEEIGDGKYKGHGQLDHGPTNMCTPCTNSRMDMIMCADHNMELMEDQDPSLFGGAAWFKALQALSNNDFDGGRLILDAKYCAICTSVAEYRCTAVQDAENLENGGSAHGCGLLLCEPCKYLLDQIAASKEHSMRWEGTEVVVLDRLIDMTKNGDGGGKDSDLRADASFLKSSDGDIMRAFLPPNYGDSDDEFGVKGGRKQRVESDEDKELDADEERRRIYDRIGKGRGVWMKKPAVAKVARASKSNRNASGKREPVSQPVSGMSHGSTGLSFSMDDMSMAASKKPKPGGKAVLKVQSAEKFKATNSGRLKWESAKKRKAETSSSETDLMGNAKSRGGSGYAERFEPPLAPRHDECGELVGDFIKSVASGRTGPIIIIDDDE